MEINTHEKLVGTILKSGDGDGFKLKEHLFNLAKERGYKGGIEDLIPDLLYATVNSDAYMCSSQKVNNYKEHLTEEEYFKILIDEMNVNY